MRPGPDRFNEPLAVDGMGDGAAHAHIVEGRHIHAHVDAAWRRGQKILIDQVGVTLLERLQILLPHPPRACRAQVDLAGTVHRQAR